MAINAYSIVQEKITAEKAACVERKKNATVGSWLRARRHYEPGCLLEAQAKYEGELEDARQEELFQTRSVNEAFIGSLDNDSQKTLIGVFVACIIIAILFYLFFS